MADIPGSTATTTTLLIGGSVTSAIDTLGDEDWIRVSLTAGDRVTFTVSNPSGSSTPLPDSVLTLYNADGVQVAFNDDANGYLSEITYTATQTGTYYLAVGAYDNASVGSYKVSAAIAPPPVPTESIDLSYEFPNSTVRVYFITAAGTHIVEPDGNSYDTSAGWTQSQINQAMLGFQQISNVADIRFAQTTSLSNADFVMILGQSDQYLGYWLPGGGNLTVGNTTVNVDGYGFFATNGTGWTSSGLQQGGYGFLTLIHEMGHGVGLAHPHDTGGGSTVMEGVTEAFGSYGLFDMNQGINTVMTYNDGWSLAPHGLPTTDGYGWQGTMMALDIAVLQQKYGPNFGYHTGNDTYVLPDVNAPGTYYQSIWDAGGIDEIVHNGTSSAIIDLRAATLQYDELGGGAVSYAQGIHGGFTIANEVVIENATGGFGADTIIGNQFANILSGRSGDDSIFGGAGNDILHGNENNDHLCGDDGNDILMGDAGNDILIGGLGVDQLLGGSGNDILYWDPLDDLAHVLGGSGTDTLMLTGSAIPFWFDLTAHELERAVADLTDTLDQYDWSQHTMTYNAQWAPLTDIGTNDDGTGWSTTYDAAGVQSWSHYRVNTDANGTITSQFTWQDDGGIWRTFYDVSGAYTWSHYRVSWDANGATTGQITWMDDGGISRTFYDVSGTQTWSHYRVSSDANGATTGQITWMDDGGIWQTFVDVADQYTWDSYRVTRDANGAITDQTTWMDDDTRWVRHYDPYNTNDWTHWTAYYDSNSQLVSTTTVYDDGSMHIV